MKKIITTTNIGPTTYVLNVPCKDPETHMALDFSKEIKPIVEFNYFLLEAPAAPDIDRRALLRELYWRLHEKDRDKHTELSRRLQNGECSVCVHSWDSKLVWNRRKLGSPEDDSLFVFAGFKKKVSQLYRYVVAVKDCWGADYKGYSCEMFGVAVGESDNPSSYPYRRIILPDPNKSKTIVHLLRHRICYEPQVAEYPLFLEVRYCGSTHSLHYDISIRGIDPEGSRQEAWLRFLIEHEQDARKRAELLAEIRKLTSKRKKAINMIDRARELQFMNEIPEMAKSTWGGPRNLKVANWPQECLEKLGTEYYRRLKDELDGVKQAAIEYFNDRKKSRTWRNHLVLDYPELEDRQDILDVMARVYFVYPTQIHPHVKKLESYEVAWEIAARRSNPDYEPFSATAETLSEHAIIPPSNEPPLDFKNQS